MKKQELIDCFSVLVKWSAKLASSGYQIHSEGEPYGRQSFRFVKEEANHDIWLSVTTKGEISIEVMTDTLRGKRVKDVYSTNPSSYLEVWSLNVDVESEAHKIADKMRDVVAIILVNSLE